MQGIRDSPNLKATYKQILDQGSVPKRRYLSLVSRTRNPQYNEVHKQQDVTRYNAANQIVAHYTDYPQRQGTPIKSPRMASVGNRQKQQYSPRETFVKNLMTKNLVDKSVTQVLFKTAVDAPIRTWTQQPRIVVHNPGKTNFVMNDYHSRETNPGFSRNEFGGRVFTR